jgi:ABC-2 type transport system ATP-binding protein
MDVHELLKYSAHFYETDCESRIRELAELFDLDLERKIIDLSRGNRKKVTILQSLIHEPGLLILDEPTSGLDPLMQAKFFDILQEENDKGTSVFFSSHTLSEVQKMCRRVGIIKEGKIIAVEDIESLRKKQLRKIQVEFSQAARLDDIECSGMINPGADGNSLFFLYAGNMKDFLDSLSGKDIKDLIIEEPSLEEIFMHYYSTEKEQNTEVCMS